MDIWMKRLRIRLLVVKCEFWIRKRKSVIELYIYCI